MRLVLLLLALLPLLHGGEDADPERLAEQCQGTGNGLRSYHDQLTDAARDAGLPLAPELPARLLAQREELLGHFLRLRTAGPHDVAAAHAADQRGQELSQAVGRLAGRLRDIASHAKQVRATPGKPEARYLEPLRAQAAAMAARILTAGKQGEEPEAERLRCTQLLFALRLLAAQLERWPRLPADHPAATAFAAWVATARARLDDALDQPLAADEQERRTQVERLYQGMHLPDQRLNHWRALLATLDERAACELPPFSPADGAALPALRAVLEQRAALERKALALLGEADALPLERLEEIDALDPECNRLINAEAAAHEGIERQRALVPVRAGIVERLAHCPEDVRKELLGRVDQLIAERSRQQGRRLKALGEGDRVDAVEAEGELELLQLRLDALGEDAEAEAWLVELEESWLAKAKEPALRENAARFRDQRGKLADARATLLKQRLQQQQVRNRIALLTLKEELTGNRIGAAEEVVQRVRTELEELREALKDAAANGAARAQEAKDAERIPLVKPGVDDF
jgi:hypothetical protein